MSDRNARADSSGDLHEIAELKAEIERLTLALKRIAAGGDNENFDAAFSHEANIAMRLQDIARAALEDDDA